MKNAIKKLGLSLLFILVIAYFAGVFYFSTFTYPNTTVSGIDKGLVAHGSVFTPEHEDYKLRVIGRDDKELDIYGDEIDFRTTVQGKPQIDQNVWLWPIEILQNNDYEVNYTNFINTNKLNDIVDNSTLFRNVQEPKDASIEIVDNKYQIVEEVKGNKLDKDKLMASIQDAIDMEETELVLEDEYINPTITKDDENLNAQFEKVNSIASRNFYFDFEDRQFDLTGVELLEMYDEIDGQMVLNNEKIRAFIIDIASKTNTYNKEHVFQATDLGEVKVPSGIYGWQMDIGGTVENLQAKIDANEEGEVEVAYLRTARERGINDIGNTYIEVDLSRQKMWLYVDGEQLIETDVVTGNASKYSAATPTGVNMVWSRERDRFLRGNNAMTGQPYEVPVSYWMPIGWTGSGIHDSQSRTQFGGDIYLTNGSSSCINTPPEAMAFIFERVSNGTPVVVYESSTNNSPTEFEKQEMIRNGEAEADIV